MYATLISGDRVRTGDELAERVDRAVGGLSALGLRAGDVIAVLMRNDFPFVEISLAAERAGIPMVPLNWHANAQELEYIMRDSEAKALFAHADLLGRLESSVPAQCTTVAVDVPPEVRPAYGIEEEDCSVGADDLDYEAWLASATPSDAPPVTAPLRLFYTSGTSGEPKGVVRFAGSPDLRERIAERNRVGHGLDRLPIRAVMPGPLYHSAPQVYAMNCVKGGELLILQPRFDAAGLLELICKHRITHLHAVPTMFNRLLDLPAPQRQAADVSSLVAVVHGAAMCPLAIKRAMIEWWGPIILEYYAATEVGIVTVSTSDQWLRYPGSVGRPPAGVQIAIVDEQGKWLPPGEVGEIFIRTELNSLVSYRDRPDAENELRRGDWITLGDIGYVNDKGFLWICDRKKDMVISGGVNILPAEIEAVITAHCAVRDCVVFGIPDRDLGEALAALVELHPNAPASAKDLQAFVCGRLGRLKAPKSVEFVEALPREDTGKIARRKLKRLFVETKEASPESGAQADGSCQGRTT